MIGRQGSGFARGFLIATAILVAIVGWFLYHEFVGLRPWSRYQTRFRNAYSEYLRKQIAQRTTEEQTVFATPEYKKLDASLGDKRAKDAQARRDQFVEDRIPGPSSSELKDLLRKVRGMEVKQRQWNIKPAGGAISYVAGERSVDRCQSCHLGMDPTLVPAGMTLTKANLGMAGSKDAPFSTHPDPELLKLHPPEKFGCSPCHGGNGGTIDSVATAHGGDGQRAAPIYAPENYEAGCQQCHAADMITEYAPVLNRGRELFRRNGCNGCHIYDGFDNEGDQVRLRQLITRLQNDKETKLRDIARLNTLGDQAKDNETATRDYRQATDLTLTASNVDAQIGQLEERMRGFSRVANKIAPDLTEVRMKLRKEWIPYWIQHTREFRPGTRMPQFPFKPGEIEAIAAYVWQTGVPGPDSPKQAPGDPRRGKQLFESRGCLGCHSIGEGAAQMGSTFSGNLSREGEKANYDYLVRFILDPRLRTRPYCGLERRMIGPEEYAKHGLPFVFDYEHDRCPNDGALLNALRPSLMPSLRLSVEEARDIASFLITQKHADAKYDPAPYMDDPKLYDKGMDLVRLYECEDCHDGPVPLNGNMVRTSREAPTLRPARTELTKEGSKTVEQVSFGPLAEKAKRGIQPDGTPSPRGSWYDLKGFIDNKLVDPWGYDTSSDKPSPADRLRMPKPDITSQADINALTTMLLGSKESLLPEDYVYRPADDAAAIQRGWWIISKYNCTGCHQIAVGQRSVLMDLPMYQEENKANLPPVLIGEGARVNPEWLANFLRNPSLSATETNRDGVRSYLEVHMPNFHLTDEQIRSLVLFFEAMAHQEQPYIPRELEPLTAAEVGMARQLFTSPAAPCLKCHATGDPAHDRNATAPNFLLAKERLRPAWTERWLTNPQLIIPGTSMPSGLFRRDKDRWVLSGPLPASLRDYHGDHANLLVRYMFQLTPEEQRVLLVHSPTPAIGN